MTNENKQQKWGTIELVLKRVWYDKIENGEKKVEYRELKPYNCKRIKGLGIVCPYAMPSGKKETRICQKDGKECVSGCQITQSMVNFRRGYTKTTMKFIIDTLSVQRGDPSLGAPENDIVINIGLGRRLKDGETYPPNQEQ